ncbi:MAG: hypothetical protein LBF22_07180 [Deltaproteobacteria bacterium]|jgi:flagellar basal body-associated protein FliL|nr:hypothetical protein [Deltaproteobacteria bacterium]
MAEKTKNTPPEITDWDSLPLDPDSSWDDVPVKDAAAVVDPLVRDASKTISPIPVDPAISTRTAAPTETRAKTSSPLGDEASVLARDDLSPDSLEGSLEGSLEDSLEGSLADSLEDSLDQAFLDAQSPSATHSGAEDSLDLKSSLDATHSIQEPASQPEDTFDVVSQTGESDPWENAPSTSQATKTNVLPPKEVDDFDEPEKRDDFDDFDDVEDVSSQNPLPTQGEDLQEALEPLANIPPADAPLSANGRKKGALDSFELDAGTNNPPPGPQKGTEPQDLPKTSIAADTLSAEVGPEDRTRFLESLLDGTEDTIPRKVELDLDGIFAEAKKEAEQLSPDSTHTPVTAPPLPPEEKLPDEPVFAPEPFNPPTSKKISKLKLTMMLLPVVLGVGGLFFGIFQIFFKEVPQPDPLDLLIIQSPLDRHKEPIPGEFTLASFYMTLESNDGSPPVVAEMEIILHYQDTQYSVLLEDNLVELRDVIFRISKAQGKHLLSDPTLRRQLQANLLRTLNELPFLKADQENQVLTYVQISLLRQV